MEATDRLLQKMGLFVNLEKSNLTPSQTFQWNAFPSRKQPEGMY